MNMKIAWVTDTSAAIDEDFISKLNIHVVPVNIIFGKEAFREHVELSSAAFYEKMRTSTVLPTTSQPIYGDFITLYQRLKKQGYTCAVAVHPTSLLSNTYASSISAAKQVGLPLYAIDSKMIAYPMRKMLQIGHTLAKEGIDTEKIVTTLQQLADQAELCGIPKNLTQLAKSGRVPNVFAKLGNFLKIKPVLRFKNGRVTLSKKVRTLAKAKHVVEDLLIEQLQNSSISEVAVLHSNNEMDAKLWKQELEHRFPEVTFIIQPLSASLAVHTGEGTCGLSWIRA